MTASRAGLEALAEALEETLARQRRRRFASLFPDRRGVGPDGATIYARSEYPRQLEFFAAGATYRERALMAANRVGKSVAGAFETTAHLTGRYPEWWQGRRFSRPVRIWAAGKTNETVRDIVQAELLGEMQDRTFAGTGMVPRDTIGRVTWRQGVADVADQVQVKHATGGWSVLGLKSYQQGRDAFEGTAQHVAWLDEECPMDIYGECLLRTATTGGIVYTTFTPLEGLTETAMLFMPQTDA